MDLGTHCRFYRRQRRFEGVRYRAFDDADFSLVSNIFANQLVRRGVGETRDDSVVARSFHRGDRLVRVQIRPPRFLRSGGFICSFARVRVASQPTGGNRATRVAVRKGVEQTRRDRTEDEVVVRQSGRRRGDGMMTYEGTFVKSISLAVIHTSRGFARVHPSPKRSSTPAATLPAPAVCSATSESSHPSNARAVPVFGSWRPK
mmetsp:Transcript_11666/g.48924  ORF Transcript_11666/g.48924 Transcript_11666/m.48924 type:complete len:203 (-) Transcript_11666:828-1436(-)